MRVMSSGEREAWLAQDLRFFCKTCDSQAMFDNGPIIGRAERSDFTQCVATGVPVAAGTGLQRVGGHIK